MNLKSLGEKAWGRGSLWLTVTRDAFIVLMPLTFLGLIALLLQHLPWAAYREVMTYVWGDGWPAHFDRLIKASHGVFGIVLAAVVATLLARRVIRPLFEAPEVPVMIVAISAVVNFMLMVSARPLFTDGLGHGGMLQGILVGIATTELLRLAMQLRWLRVSDAPYETDSTYHDAMRLAPAIIATGLFFFLCVGLLATLPVVSLQVLSPVVTWAQLQQTDATWVLSSLATLLNQSAWFLGIHGGKIIDTYGAAFFTPFGSSYTNALVWRPLFNHFALMGGAGATICLVIAILLTVKRGHQNQIAKWSVFPAIFNINEAILYGLPIVLNGIYFVPFLCVPLLFTLMTLAATETGLIRFLAVDIPWTTPPILSGWLLTGSWRGAALQCVEICLGVALYLPFVRATERARKERGAKAVSVALKQIAEESQKLGKFVIRPDQTGLIARSLLADLCRLYKKNDGELWLAYQPKHDASGGLVGVEALVRWNHSVYGPISPLVIIALTENSGYIHKLGSWVLEQACACKARWNALGYRELVMGVNLSPLQLEDYALTTKLEQLLRCYGLEPSEIELEITESAVIPDSQGVEQTLHKFEEMGVRLAMDDFGMGYSSLLHLRRFHVHAIKIDGSLTRDVLCNSTNADIIRTIVALGRSQKVEVVAEYVETLEQRMMLAELGCDIFQGYYHSPALPELQCPAYFAKNQYLQEEPDEPNSASLRT